MGVVGTRRMRSPGAQGGNTFAEKKCTCRPLWGLQMIAGV